MARHSRTRVDRSAAALGLGYKQWTRNDLHIILDHYGVRFAAGDSNRALIRSLNRLAAQRGLTRQDRLTIINAHKADTPLPSRRPTVRVPANSSSFTPPVVTPSALISQPDNYSSNADHESDTDMSDSEDIEEIPSLSEEERDLREYTATMSLRPGPRVRAPRAVNRTLPANRSIVGNQRAAVNQVPRSTSVAVIRAETTNNSISDHRARPHATKAIPTIEPESGSSPSASRNTRVANHECLICYDAFDPVKSLARQPTSSCEHEINICRPCLAASISSQSGTRPWNRISCPAFTCETLLTYEDIQEFAEPQVFTRYLDFTFEAAQAGSHFQRCRTPGCKSGQQYFPVDTIMTCHECRQKTCITCDTQMHPGISCREKAAEREAVQQTYEPASARYLNTKTKACPGCKAPSQKTGGCDHMTCNICSHEYCWSCLADHGPINEYGNHHHDPTCRHHSDNL